MSNLIKWPFGNDIFPSVKNLLNEFWMDTPEFFNRMINTGTTLPAANFKENDQTYEIELAVPGMSKEDLKIGLENNRLTVSAEKKAEKEEKEKDYTRREFSFSSFSRSFSLPENVNQDAVNASYADGVLHLSVPKLAEVKAPAAREIAIK